MAAFAAKEDTAALHIPPLAHASLQPLEQSQHGALLRPHQVVEDPQTSPNSPMSFPPHLSQVYFLSLDINPISTHTQEWKH